MAYTFDPRTGRYRDEGGRFVTERTIRDAVDNLADCLYHMSPDAPFDDSLNQRAVDAKLFCQHAQRYTPGSVALAYIDDGRIAQSGRTMLLTTADPFGQALRPMSLTSQSLGRKRLLNRCCTPSRIAVMRIRRRRPHVQVSRIAAWGIVTAMAGKLPSPEMPADGGFYRESACNVAATTVVEPTVARWDAITHPWPARGGASRAVDMRPEPLDESCGILMPHRWCTSSGATPPVVDATRGIPDVAIIPHPLGGECG